jgi:hypothetical protein
MLRRTVVWELGFPEGGEIQDGVRMRRTKTKEDILRLTAKRDVGFIHHVIDSTIHDRTVRYLRTSTYEGANHHNKL